MSDFVKFIEISTFAIAYSQGFGMIEQILQTD